jgi:hypothetical protein
LWSFLYCIMVFFGTILFLYHGSTQVSTCEVFCGPCEVTKVTMACCDGLVDINRVRPILVRFGQNLTGP